MKIDDLVKVYESHGIKASVPDLRNVVMALRDDLLTKMGLLGKLTFTGEIIDGEDVEEWANSILGDAGEPTVGQRLIKAAKEAAAMAAGSGIAERADEQRADAAPAADISEFEPMSDPRLESPIKPMFLTISPAAEPSVCEWVVDGQNLWVVNCKSLVSFRTFSRPPTNCPSCGKPITFKEKP